MKFKQAIFGMNRYEIIAAFCAFDRHPFVMGWGLIGSATRGADSVEHHSITELMQIEFITRVIAI